MPRIQWTELPRALRYPGRVTAGNREAFDANAENAQTPAMTTKLDIPNDLVADSSMLEERKRIADKFITRQWGGELAGFEEGRVADCESAEVRSRAWRR